MPRLRQNRWHASWEGITKLQPKPDEHVLLYGAGPIGLMYIKVLRALGIETSCGLCKRRKT